MSIDDRKHSNSPHIFKHELLGNYSFKKWYDNKYQYYKEFFPIDK